MTADPGQFGRRRLRPPEQTANTPDLAEVLAPGVGHDLPPVRMDTWRYLRVAWFFARMFLSTIWWDLVSAPRAGPARRRAAQLHCRAGRRGRNGSAGWRCHRAAS